MDEMLRYTAKPVRAWVLGTILLVRGNESGRKSEGIRSAG